MLKKKNTKKKKQKTGMLKVGGLSNKYSGIPRVVNF